MFRPNQIAQHLKRTGRDLHARETFAPAAPIQIALVKLEVALQRTTVRADSSASRGAAEETVTKGKILVDKRHHLQRNDRVIFNGETFRVIMIHPRYSVWGQLDHFEVDLQMAPQ
jgi:hypothetical protein